MREFVPHDVLREDRTDGSILLRSRLALGPVARSTGAWLHRWANEAPDRVFLAERSGHGWRELRYGAALEQVRAVAQSLLARGLGPDRPVAIISGNGIEHAILALAGQYVGVPVVALAEQYALIPGAHPRLVQAMEASRPALVFADDAARYGAALALGCMEGIEKVAAATEGSPVPVTAWSRLLQGEAGTPLDEAHAGVGPDTVARIMFTSGSTSAPKGVVTTHRMLCVNQAQLRAVMPLLAARPPRIVDWLPWNHVFGASHNFNLILANGGTLYVDEGKPTKAGFAATVRNVREQGGTIAFNVPVGFAQMVAAMERDEELKRAYLGDCDLVFYAAASVTREVWETLARFAVQVRGEVPLMFSAWGMSETAPGCLQTHQPVKRPGNIGVPLPMVTAKLVPSDEDGRYELRVAGPNVMPGYHRDPARTCEAFDAEGFLVTGDAVRLVDPADAAAGLAFDGRVAEDFKLLTGTWVRATNVRLDALRHFADLAWDLVVTGHDRDEVGLLLFPHPSHLRPGDAAAEPGGVLASPELLAAVRSCLRAAAAHATGSSTRITRAMVLATAPSMAEGEMTAKGSINARRVLSLRRQALDRLYDDADPALVRL